jgi:outer membrane protein TolC
MLSKTEALQILMDNNFDVRLSKEQLKIAETNTQIFNSGYLPTLSGNANLNYNIDEINAEFQDGRTSELSGAKSDSRSAGLSLNYVLFNGFNRKYNMDRNRELLNRGQLVLRSTLESSILSLFNTYYLVAQSQQNVANLEETLRISRERLLRTEYGFEYGRSTRLDLSNAQVDVNSDSISLLNALQDLANTKRNLNFLLGVDANQSFEIDTTVSFSSLIDKEVFFEAMQSDNVQLLVGRSDININKSATKVTQSNYYPTLAVNGGYNYRLGNNNSASFLATSTSSGLNYGASLSWNIFDGGFTKTNTQIAKINESISTVSLEQLENDLQVQFENAWGDYQNKLFVVKAQEKNLATNRENFERSIEQYKLGRINSVTFRTAQRNLLLSEVGLTQAKYDAKRAELLLFQIAGKITEAEF